jgi:hypothetical protein
MIDVKHTESELEFISRLAAKNLITTEEQKAFTNSIINNIRALLLGAGGGKTANTTIKSSK